MTIVAATDGSALGNPGPAGWAWFIDEKRWGAGGWAHGTNNMGELTAVLELLRATASSPEGVQVYCDSQYVINTVTKWMAGWKAKGWRKRDGKPPENLQIIKDIDAAMTGRTVTFTWVKGHAGHPLNEAADVRAQAAAAAHQAGRLPDSGPGFDDLGTAGSTPLPDRPAAAAPPTAGDEDALFEDLDDLADQPVEAVLRLERDLLGDETRADTARLAEILDPDWRGITPTGRLLTRDDVLLDGLEPTRDALDLVDARRVGPDQVHVVSRRVGAAGSALHASWWVRHQGRWRLLFEQSTPEA